MYVLLTVGNMYYSESMMTFDNHMAAYEYARANYMGWFDIIKIY